ncbi:YccF domain-containing protein [Streptoalloteichus tenebrarius]|uniref:YccF domain-containing protein n=1 Tax=Streptoalloteichus tenebrarius (strain ATCC 17920 / DSM 40477 / JCM 4838 / CBS 697.72 / NBRC 16177 / NCIMB 11028 / NRRL B-12390 / A12253. 1 / ISP 5477) TaxID=1933 RepID=UPI0020A2A8DB|nr:YccF domain-containing protein [Streptoalloteichus tenebrarius]BFF01404.1 YccF domain-containing protein [Streptoalloteichus tenebrarius]
MRLLLNVIWLVFGGLLMALGYALAGVLCCVLVVTIPFGIASFRMAAYTLWPFGRTIVDRPGAGAGSAVGNVVWILVAGWWLALGHVVTGIAQCLTVVGIPLGVGNLKLVPVSLTPLGKAIVDVDDRTAFAPRR